MRPELIGQYNLYFCHFIALFVRFHIKRARIGMFISDTLIHRKGNCAYVYVCLQ